MSFLNSFKRLFRFGGDDDHLKKRQWNKNIKKDIDPLQLWDIVSELGDGAFGRVYKVSFRVLSSCFHDVRTRVSTDSAVVMLHKHMYGVCISTHTMHKTNI